MFKILKNVSLHKLFSFSISFLFHQFISLIFIIIISHILNYMNYIIGKFVQVNNYYFMRENQKNVAYPRNLIRAKNLIKYLNCIFVSQQSRYNVVLFGISQSYSTQNCSSCFLVFIKCKFFVINNIFYSQILKYNLERFCRI